MTSFIDMIRLLVEKICWGITAGEGSGSVISLEFGKKIERTKYLKNNYLTENQKKFNAEYDLFIECSWRINDSQGAICSSKSPNDNYGTMLLELKKIVDQKVVSIEINELSYDLVLHFDNDLKLYIFCDETNENEDIDNYTFATPDHNYIVGCKSIIRQESRIFN